MGLSRRTPLKSKTSLKSNGKGLKRGSGLKSNSTLKSNSQLKAKKKINQKSSKQRKIESSYEKQKREVYVQNELCTGCERSTNTTASHLIPRSRRRDLVDVIEQVKPHCIPCHEKWESVNRVELLDYEENMKIVKRLDPEYHTLLLMKQKRHGR